MSARADRATRATALRERGLKLREIAAEMGEPISTVHELITDPDLSKHHARMRQRYGGICIDCGAPTSWPRGPIRNGPAKRCAACASVAQIVWTRELIIAALHEWTRLYGRTPSSVAWNPSLARSKGQLDLVERFYAGRWPSTSIVQKRFGSWNAAIDAAGLPRNRNGRPPKVAA